MPNNRNAVICGIVKRTVIESKDCSHNFMHDIEYGIKAMREVIRKGRTMGFSAHDLNPYRRELARLLCLRFHSLHSIYRKNVVIWTIPVVPHKDSCNRLMETICEAAIRQLQELNAENGTDYQFD